MTYQLNCNYVSKRSAKSLVIFSITNWHKGSQVWKSMNFTSCLWIAVTQSYISLLIVLLYTNQIIQFVFCESYLHKPPNLCLSKIKGQNSAKPEYYKTRKVNRFILLQMKIEPNGSSNDWYLCTNIMWGHRHNEARRLWMLIVSTMLLLKKHRYENFCE